MNVPYALILNVAGCAEIPFVRQNDNKAIIRCPWHDDKVPSAFLSLRRNVFSCSACSLSLSAKQFAEKLGLDWTPFAEICRSESSPIVAPEPERPRLTTEHAAALWRSAIEHTDKLFTDDALDDPGLKYLQERGLFEATDPEPNSIPLAAIIPPAPSYGTQDVYRDIDSREYRIAVPLWSVASGHLQALQLRRVTPHHIKIKSVGPTSASVFANLSARGVLSDSETDSLTLCEGWADFLSFAIASPLPVFGVPGVGLTRSVLENGGPRPWISRTKTVRIAMHSDEKGVDAAKLAASRLPGSVNIAYPSGIDANDLLRANKGSYESFLAAITACETPAPGAPVPFIPLDLASIAINGIPPKKWLLPGWLAEDDIALFAGVGGIGKSTTAAAMAVSLALGVPWCGIVPAKPIKCLWFDEEQGDEETARTFIRLGAHTAPNLQVCSTAGLNMKDPAIVARLDVHIQKFLPNIIFLDSAQQTLGIKDENSASEVGEVFRTLFRVRSQYNLAIFIVHHKRKSYGTNTQDLIELVRGSSSFTTQSSLVVLAVKGPQDNTLDLKMAKRRGGKRLSMRTAYSEESGDGPISISGEGSIVDAEIERTKEWILDFLSGRGPVQLKDLKASAKTLNISGRSVDRALKILLSENDVTKPKYGTYEIRGGTSPSPLDF